MTANIGDSHGALNPLPDTPSPVISSDPKNIRSLPPLKRSEIFQHTLSQNFKILQDTLLEPFAKLVKGEKLNWKEKLVLIVAPFCLFINPAIAGPVFLLSGGAALGHALWFTAVGKLPDYSSNLNSNYGKL